MPYMIPVWTVVVDEPQYKHLLIRIGYLWWAKYYVAKRPRFDIFGHYSGIQRVSEPLKNKKVGLAMLKLME